MGVEQYWRQRLKAHRAYLSACEQHKRMVEEMIKGGISIPDGSFAIAKARRAESAALSEYRRLVGIYKRAVLGQDVPLGDNDAKPLF